MKTTLFNLVKRIPAKKKILSLVLALSLLISLFPISDVTAWSAPANVTINKSADASYFTNQWGTPLTTGFYFVADSGVIAYCADQEATGPGGTGYSLNDGGLGNAAYLSGIQAIIQNGYPKYSNGLSADDARYATQIAIHWIENYYLGAGQGYDASIRGTTNANGHDGALAFALALYDVGVSVAPIIPVMTLGAPSAWADVGGGVLQCNLYVDETSTDFWQILSLPAGVTSVGGTTFSGDVNLTLQLTDAVAYAASPKTVTLEGYSNRDISNIHVFTTSGGYQSMVAVSTQSNGLDPSSVTLQDTNGTLSLYKQTEWSTGVYSSEAGATFQIYNSAAAVVATITTDASGNASASLPYGAYTIHQVSGPGYTVLAPDQAYTVSASSPTATITNTVFTGQIEINKTYAAVTGSVPEAGAIFQIFPNGSTYATSADYQRDQITTNGSGYALSKSLPYGTYTLVQTGAPIGSQINGSTWTFELGVDGSTYINGDVDTVSISNTPNYGKFEILKTTDRGYSAVEAGAVFEVYSTAYASYAAAPAALKDTLTTSSAGTAITKDLPFGVYRVHQTSVPVGTKAAADFTVTIGSVNGKTIHGDIVDQTYWGKIQIQKYKSAPSDSTGLLLPESDAVFRVFLTSAGSYDGANAYEKDVLTTGITGLIISKNLPYGQYTVEQIDSPATLLTFKVDSWQVNIGAVDNQTYSYVRNNEIYEQYLTIIKTDAETGQAIKIAGARFQILASDGSTVLADSNGNSSFVTDPNGCINITDLPLQVGNYFIKETVAPKGYVLNSKPKAFAVSIGDHGSSSVTIDYGVDVRTELFADTAQTCQLIVEKQGEVLTSVKQIPAINTITGAQYSDLAGTKLNVFNFGYSLTGKAGAVFEVFVGASTIADINGQVKTIDLDGDGVKEKGLTAGASLGMITTSAVLQKDGTTKYIASLAGLPLDAVSGTAQYIVREITAPKGDLVNAEPLIYDFTFANQTTSQINQDQSITDARQKVQITIEKQKEAGTWNNDTKSFDWPLVAAPEILFGLFTTNNILSPDGSVLVAADTLVDVLYTNAAGEGAITQDLPMGNYYAKELNVTPDVLCDSKTEYPLTAVPTSDQIAPVVTFTLNDGNAIINRQVAGTMEIYKITADTNIPMVGVVFEVYDKAANLVDIVITDSDGCAKTKVLPYGRYTLIETRSTTGYALHDKQTFSIYIAPVKGKYISEAKMTIEDQKMAQIEVYKVTADGTSIPMNGVIFGVFDAVTNAEIARITTDIKGYGSVYALEGNYFLQEIKTWDGYALSTEKIPIAAEYAHLYTFHQSNTLTELRVMKTSTSGAPLAGMQFTVTNKETGQLISFVYDETRKGYVSTSVLKTLLTDQTITTTTGVTGAGGTALILGLTEGEYIITEIVAPTGYNLDSKPTSTTIGTQTSGVLGGSVTIINSPVIPKTGEIGNNYNSIMAGLCCLGFATTMLIILRVRKRMRKKLKVRK